MTTKNWITLGGVFVAALAASYGIYRMTDDSGLLADRSSADEQAASVGGPNGTHRIELETNHGSIRFETFDADAPKAAQNFIKLAGEGFYNDLTFHRVIEGFMIQGGDPNCGESPTGTTSAGTCGTGGPGYMFEDELNPETESYKIGYKKGIVAMANAGPNTNGSQFFIMLEDYPLPHNYTIFGRVTEGQDVVDAIGRMETDAGDRPVTSVVILRATVSVK